MSAGRRPKAQVIMQGTIPRPMLSVPDGRLHPRDPVFVRKNDCINVNWLNVLEARVRKFMIRSVGCRPTTSLR